MRRRSEEFNADSLAFLVGIAEKHDAGFLLFLSEWIGEYQHSVQDKWLVEIHQSAVGVNHDGLASLAEPPVVGVFPGDHYTHTHEDSRAAPGHVDIPFWHSTSMLRHFQFAVNESVIGVFPHRNVSLELTESANAQFLASMSVERVMIPSGI
jgi:hypothetical protein